jgi:hypothetical protein
MADHVATFSLGHMKRTLLSRGRRISPYAHLFKCLATYTLMHIYLKVEKRTLLSYFGSFFGETGELLLHYI